VGRLNERWAVASRALVALNEVLARGVEDPILRDAAIQRFEFTLEAAWKAAQLWLRTETGEDLASPKAVIRAMAATERVAEPVARQLLAAIDDRNLTVHTYSERTAKLIADRLSAHAVALGVLITAIAPTLPDR
jgi:nucleotidyltransferase substrate binding protein (TIGR01987 family)